MKEQLETLTTSYKELQEKNEELQKKVKRLEARLEKAAAKKGILPKGKKHANGD
jgi:phage shock protein A